MISKNDLFSTGSKKDTSLLRESLLNLLMPWDPPVFIIAKWESNKTPISPRSLWIPCWPLLSPSVVDNELLVFKICSLARNILY